MATDRKIRLTRLQFRLSWLIGLTCLVALGVQFGPAAWHRLFPPAMELPSQYYEASGNDLLYFPREPEFSLSEEAAALKASRDNDNVDDPPPTSDDD